MRQPEGGTKISLLLPLSASLTQGTLGKVGQGSNTGTLHWLILGLFLNREDAGLVAQPSRASCFRSKARILPGIRKTKSGTASVQVCVI